MKTFKFKTRSLHFRRRTIFLLTTLVFFSLAIDLKQAGAKQWVTTASGGSIQTVLSPKVKINKGSSLTREWITVHDDQIRATFSNTHGISTRYVSYAGGGYRYGASFIIKAQEALSAIEVRFLLFDIWGEHTKSLSTTEIVDIKGGATKKFTGQWNIFSENEVSNFYASIAYISRVRTKSGLVIYADPRLVLEQAKRYSDKFAEKDLEPKPAKK